MSGSKLAVLLGRWGAPPDAVATIALVLGLLCLVAPLASRDPLEGAWRASRGRFLAGAGLAAGFLTLGFAAHYLRGGPRIIDATAYVLQAKALAHGHFAWRVPWPTASFRGRFLLFVAPDRLAGIFPPGWPLLLAVGCALGSLLLVGVALAAALAVATYALALELAAANPSPHGEAVARLAALLSVVCSALRYQTADPMSHAATALAVTVAFALALRLARGASRERVHVLLGLALGYVVCTRPVSVLPIAFVVVWLVRPARLRGFFLVALGALPGVALLLASQHAATGSFLTSTQRAYYAVSDGPADCFRYGFGRGVGCLHEHGDFVAARLAHGYGLLAAAGTTLRRLHVHLSDALDAWPVLLCVVPACAAAARRDRALRLAWLLVGLQVLAYAPFYFDGDYPGAGARFFADVLPVEHAAIALSLAAFLPSLAFAKKAAALLGLVAVGFALHGAYDDIALASRDGGRPMFEPERLEDAHLDAGLLFVDTDHGFDLADDPAATDPAHGLVVARLRNDGHDRLLWERLGRPRAWAYRFGVRSNDRVAEPSLLPFTPPPAEIAGRELWRFESEADWPPLAQRGAWAEPVYATGARQSCPSGGQVLAVRPDPNEGSVTIAVPVPRKARWTVRPYVLVEPGDGPVELRLGELRWSGAGDVDTKRATCVDLGPKTADLGEGEMPLEIRVTTGPVHLDRIELGNR